MEEGWFNLVELAKRPAVVETFVDILLCAVPIWVAVMIGLLIGWSWRPRWTSLVFIGLRSKLRFVWTAPPGFGARRLWLAFTALSAFSVARRLWFGFRGRNKDRPSKATEDVAALSVAPESVECDAFTSHLVQKPPGDIRTCTRVLEREQSIITENDLEELLHFLDDKDADIAWQSMMERSTSNLTYQAWRYEPEIGPTVYRSRTVFEDATAELVRDFFWDDEFRSKWDPMLGHFKTLEECSQTGTIIVQWIKKFPFFCSDREYIFGRRIWEAGKTYYCVTKGVPYPAVQKRDKPRRVDLYFSSWVIKPVQSHRGDGQFSACEVALIHYEDMGIPKDVAKLGVRHGMWGTVKKLNSGFRAYQHARKTEASLSRCAQMARITTKLCSHENLDSSNSSEEQNVLYIEKDKGRDRIDWKWVVIGGTVALVCGFRTGIVGKAFLLGAGHRVAQR